MSIGRSPIQTYIDVQAVTRLARFLASPQVDVTGLAGLDRAMLERYLADLATDPRAVRSRSRDISSISAFLDAVRRHEWDHSLPASAAFYPDDFPKPEKRLPRGLAEHIMAQVEQPSNLDRWHNPEQPAAHRHPHALRPARRGRDARSRSTASSATATARPTCATSTAR